MKNHAWKVAVVQDVNYSIAGQLWNLYIHELRVEA